MENSTSTSENIISWLELPADVMLMILMKLQQQEILKSVQFVCKTWYGICKDPRMWRAIRFKDLTVTENPPAVFNREKMVYNAVDRSAGGLIELDICGFAPAELCSYIASRSSKLKRLWITHCKKISSKTMVEALEKLTCLEELHIYDPIYFELEEIVSIVRSCPSTISSLKLKQAGVSGHRWPCDKVAFAIAKTMPELRHLQLINNDLTNVGLTSILEGCSHLQSLDLRACFHLDINGDILKRLEKQVKHLRHPNESIEDDDFPIIEYVLARHHLRQLAMAIMGVWGRIRLCHFEIRAMVISYTEYDLVLMSFF